jgi:hypothetical protein
MDGLAAANCSTEFHPDSDKDTVVFSPPSYPKTIANLNLAGIGKMRLASLFGNFQPLTIRKFQQPSVIELEVCRFRVDVRTVPSASPELPA